MGKAASSLGYFATKPFREFNLEQRVVKELTKDKRPAAPRHQTTASRLDRAVDEKVKGSLSKKDEDLHHRLKSVYVTSEDVKPVQTGIKDNPNRPLPMDRSVMEEPEFGYAEPKSVPYGKVTLRSAVEAITRHQEDPRLWTPRRLAIEYRLSLELTEKMLKHFQVFFMVVPQDSKVKIADSAARQSPFIKQLPSSANTTQGSNTESKTTS